jgi:hypothetical protein
LTAGKCGEALAGFTRYQSFQSCPYQRGLLANASQFPGSLEEIRVNDQGSSHMHQYGPKMHMKQAYRKCRKSPINQLWRFPAQGGSFEAAMVSLKRFLYASEQEAARAKIVSLVAGENRHGRRGSRPVRVRELPG